MFLIIYFVVKMLFKIKYLLNLIKPYLAIVDALRSIRITLISQINHLKAGINVEGYEHMSFCRQMFLNHKDI